MAIYTRFRDIPRFVRLHYSVHIALDYLESTLAHYSEGRPLNLRPDFQRGHVWTEAQQIAFVEFFLRGGISGRDIYFNHPGWMKGFKGDFVLVDGLQRLTAVRRFLASEIPAFGTLYRDYTDEFGLTNNHFIFHIASLQTRAEVLQWYIDLNAGGTPHTNAEIERVRALLAAETG